MSKFDPNKDVFYVEVNSQEEWGRLNAIFRARSYQRGSKYYRFGRLAHCTGETGRADNPYFYPSEGVKELTIPQAIATLKYGTHLTTKHKLNA